MILINVVMPVSVRIRADEPSLEESSTVLEDAAGPVRAAGGALVKELQSYAGVKGPAHEILEAARNEGCDLIVTGNRGHSAWVGLALGSVSQRVSDHAPCPVLVVPGKDAPPPDLHSDWVPASRVDASSFAQELATWPRLDQLKRIQCWLCPRADRVTRSFRQCGG